MKEMKISQKKAPGRGHVVVLVDATRRDEPSGAERLAGARHSTDDARSRWAQMRTHIGSYQ